MYCIKCNTQLPDNIAICPKCGAKINLQNTVHIDDKNEPNNKLHLIGYILAWIAILCNLEILFYVYTSSYKNPAFESLGFRLRCIIMGIMGLAALIVSIKARSIKKNRLSQGGMFCGGIVLIESLLFLIITVWL